MSATPRDAMTALRYPEKENAVSSVGSSKCAYQEEHGSEQHDDRCDPSRNPQILRKAELFDNRGIRGHEHNQEHQRDGHDSVYYCGPEQCAHGIDANKI